MSSPLPLRCRCGTVRGTLSGVGAADRKRAICYCDDCQIYAHHLGRSDILDEHGGTGAVMSAPANVQLSEGAEQVRCVRLGPKGLYRWYASCCNTPLGNTIAPKLPVLIVVMAAVDFEGLGRSPDEALGPPAIRMLARFAKGGPPPGAHPGSPLSALPLLLTHVLGGFLKGRAQPSPFLDAQGKPRVEPVLIDKAERESYRARIRADAGLPAQA